MEEYFCISCKKFKAEDKHVSMDDEIRNRLTKINDKFYVDNDLNNEFVFICIECRNIIEQRKK